MAENIGLDLPDSPRPLSGSSLPTFLTSLQKNEQEPGSETLSEDSNGVFSGKSNIAGFNDEPEGTVGLRLSQSSSPQPARSIVASPALGYSSPNILLETSSELNDSWEQNAKVLRTEFRYSLTSTDQLKQETDDDRVKESANRLQQMLANTSEDSVEEEEQVSVDEVLHDATSTTDEKKVTLQHMLIVASSNGDLARIKRLLDYADARQFVEVNTSDEEGTSALIYAACFGHADIASLLIANGADVDQQDKFKWSPLMWATNNNHTGIVKLLLNNGASLEVRTATGRTAQDFSDPKSEISEIVRPLSGQVQGVGVRSIQDFYNDDTNPSLNLDDNFVSNEIQKKLLLESSSNLDVDLANLGITHQDDDDVFENETEFDWDHCLPDQMFVFSAEDLPRILDLAINKMHPLRSSNQKPIPANVIFLCARFAHYYGTPDLLKSLFYSSIEKISYVVEVHEDDMAFLAFWLSNVTLLLYFLRKDTGLMAASVEHQQQLTDLVSEIFVLFIRDVERRLDRILDAAILDHETIPGLGNVQFQREWKIFRSGWKNVEGRSSSPGGGSELDQYRPPSLSKMIAPSSRNVTSLLSSTLLVLDLYDIHPVITLQLVGQIFYWLNATIFNRILSDRKYLARTKAMQIRLNISAIEDWARANNRRPVEIEPGVCGSGSSMFHESIIELSRRHLLPLVQLLQWLQCFSSLGDDTASLIGTLKQLPLLTAEQLLHAVKNYRAEVGEDKLSKSAIRYLKSLEQQQSQPHKQAVAGVSSMARKSKLFNQILPGSPSPPPQQPSPQAPPSPARSTTDLQDITSSIIRQSLESNAGSLHLSSPVVDNENLTWSDAEQHQRRPGGLYLDISLILPFVIPTTTEMLITWGAGIGGLNRAQAQRHAPFLPPEFVAKLDATSSLSTGVPSMKSGIVGSGRARDNSTASRYQYGSSVASGRRGSNAIRSFRDGSFDSDDRSSEFDDHDNEKSTPSDVVAEEKKRRNELESELETLKLNSLERQLVIEDEIEQEMTDQELKARWH
ncbi:hypothetical protein V1514DRAFT_324394 [Lipomyces japonicus]|uniref:uncharacterized protein n=1 Tax=Lipomyces japonicus TaxID=56871 RepID=UPI0034CD022D